MRSNFCKETRCLNISGFGLLELIIVVAIASLLVMLAVPTYSNFISNARLDSATQNLFSALNQARQLALTQG